MKKILSLFISYIMLFNLTAPVFAQYNRNNSTGMGDFGIKTNNNVSLGNKKLEQGMERMKKEAQQLKDYSNAYNTNGGNYTTAKAKATSAMIQRDIDNRIIESVPQKDRIVANMLGASYYAFKEQLAAYPDADLEASWKDYVKSLADYNAEYIVLTRKFDMENPPYEDLRSEMSSALLNKKEKVSYGGKEYSIDAFLHAAIHNLVTRKGNGRMEKGFWVFSEEKEGEFSIEDKLTTMPYIYATISKYGYYPKDREYIWAYTYDIVANGKKYFDNDTYKADLLPNIVSNAAKDERDRGKEQRSKQASAVATAMALLPIISEKPEEIEKASEAIYQLMNDVLGVISTYDYASVAIVTGASALIAFNKESSLSKLMTFLLDDCKKGKVKGLLNFIGGFFSAEEWTKGIARAGDIHKVEGAPASNPNSLELTGQEMGSTKTARVDGGYSYHNSLSAEFSYIDKSKTPFNEAWLAGNSGGAEESYNVIFTDIFEEIGRELGSNAASPVVKSYIHTFANRLSNKGFNKNFSDDDLTISIVAGILQTAPQGDTSLRYAADLIYTGSWWDLNEATQRDKNNIAAAYLGKSKKGYNKEKDEAFKKIFKAKYASTYVDMVSNAVMVATLIYSAPAIIKGFARWTGKSINNFKNTAGAIKNVRLSTSPKVGVRPATTRGASIKTAAPSTKVATTTGKTATTTTKGAQTVSTANKAVPAATNTAQATKTATQTAEEIRAAQIAKTQEEMNQFLGKAKQSILGNSSKKLYSSFLGPIPGLFEDSPRLRSLFEAASKSTAEAIKTKGLSLEEAKTFFMKNFEARLDFTFIMPKARKASVLNKAAKALDVTFERSAATALKPKYLAAQADANGIGILVETSYGERIPITLSQEDLAILSNGDTIEFGSVILDKNTLRFLEDAAKIDPDIATHLQAVKKPGVFDKLKGIFEREKTYTLGNEPVKTPSVKQNSMQVVEIIEDTPKTLSQTGKNAKPATSNVASKGNSVTPIDEPTYILKGGKDSPVLRPVGIIEDGAEVPAKAGNVGKAKPTAEPQNALPPAQNTNQRALPPAQNTNQRALPPAQNANQRALPTAQAQKALPAGQKAQKALPSAQTQNALPAGQTAQKALPPAQNANQRALLPAQNAKQLALPPVNKVEYLRGKGYDGHIKDFENAGLLKDDASFAKLQQMVERRIHPKDILSCAENNFKNMDALVKRADNIAYVEKNIPEVGTRSAWEKYIINSDYKNGTNMFNRAKTLFEKGFAPAEVVANRATILEGSNFERIQNLSAADFNKLSREGLFSSSNYAVTERLLQEGYKADGIIKLSKERPFAKVSPETYMANLQRQATPKPAAQNTSAAESSVDRTVVKTKEGNTITAESYWEDIPTPGAAKSAQKVNTLELSEGAKYLIDDGQRLVQQIEELEGNISRHSFIWQQDPMLFQSFEELKQSIYTLQKMRAANAESAMIEHQLTSVRTQLDGVWHNLEHKIGVVEEMGITGHASSADLLILDEVKSLQDLFGKVLSSMYGV